MRFSLLIITFVCLNSVFAQSNDTLKIRSTIDQFFEGMASGDSATVHSLFYFNSKMSTVYSASDKSVKVVETKLQQFVTAISTPHKEKWEERFKNLKINISGPMAHIWMDYSFYVDGILSHCGVNSFTMIKTQGRWLILSITDTRNKNECN